jgi:hypothetical protein
MVVAAHDLQYRNWNNFLSVSLWSQDNIIATLLEDQLCSHITNDIHGQQRSWNYTYTYIYIYDNQQWRHLTILRAGSYVGKFKMYGVFLARWSHCRRCCLSTVSAVSPKMDDNIFTVDPQIQRQGMSLVSSKSLVATHRGINWYGVGWRSLKVFSFICNLWYQLQVFRSSLFLVVHLGTFDPCSMLCRRDLLSREL